MKRRLYLTSNVSGSLGVLDGNGISSQVIAFRLGLIPGLLIVFLQRKLITLVTCSQGSLITMPSLETYSLGINSFCALFVPCNWQGYSNDLGKCLNRKLMT